MGSDFGFSGVIDPSASSWPTSLPSPGLSSTFVSSDAGASMSDASSSSPASIAITSPTFTPSVPSATMILPSVPSSTASNSIVALSVSISAMMSPISIASPSCFSHLASVPSSIVGERAGIFSSIAMAQYSSTRTSVKSSAGSGSGEFSAKSAASLTILRISLSMVFSSSSLLPCSIRSFLIASIGSLWSR